jgi:hypothetical protein
MRRSTLLALLLFCANTAVGTTLMWMNRPRTVADMPRSDLDWAERRRLRRMLDEAGVLPSVVRVCTVAPCTDGPAVFIADQLITRVVLPAMHAPTPVVEVRR